MPRFPKSQAPIAALAEQLWRGLLDNNAIFSQPPVHPMAIRIRKLIGWAGKKAKTPLAPPGQTRLLEAPKQGTGWLFLDWKAPADGGKPKAYKVQRRVRDSGDWKDVATAILSEITLDGIGICYLGKMGNMENLSFLRKQESSLLSLDPRFRGDDRVRLL